MNNNLNFKCETIVNNKYRLILSEKITLDKNGYADFKISIDEEQLINILIRFENDDSDQTKIKYSVSDDDVILTAYNIHPNPNNEYTIFSNKKEIIEIDNTKYYLESSITIYSNLYKQVNIDLYEEIN